MTWLRSRGRARALILGYHRVGTPGSDPYGLSVSEATFERHLDAIARFARTASLSEVADALPRGGPSPGTVVLTFDDAYALTLRRVEPLLRTHRVPATVFVPTALLDAEPWWDRLARLLSTRQTLPAELPVPLGRDRHLHRRLRGEERQAGMTPTSRTDLILDMYRAFRPLSRKDRIAALEELAAVCAGTEPCPETRVASADELVALDGSETFEIGSHSVTHPVLPELPVDVQRTELGDSRETLEAILGHPVDLFSYPNGARDPGTDRVVEEAGYRVACTSASGVVTHRSSRFALPRFWPEDCPDAVEKVIRRWL
ncbi:MAG: polysaccharide deacetylase family protein [Gemmatimonadota bacterium]